MACLFITMAVIGVNPDVGAWPLETFLDQRAWPFSSAYSEQCVPASTCASDNDGWRCALDGGVAGTCCGGICADLSSDPNNCEVCGATCPTGFSCQYGYCTNLSIEDCPDGSSPTYAGSLCVPSDCSQQSDGTSCALPDGGLLGLPGQCCSKSCTDLHFDALNCGACGRACGTNEACIAGVCGAFTTTCAENGDLCIQDGGAPGLCCAGRCVASYYFNQLNGSSFVDLWPEYWPYYADSESCGACGAGCAVGATCEFESGITPPGAGCSPGAGLSGSYSDCSLDSDCSSDRFCYEFCIPRSCDAGTPLCWLDGGIVPIGTCCNGLCVDPRSDSANCQQCGNFCASGTQCVNGQCVTDAGVGCEDPGYPCPAGTICGGYPYVPGACLPATCQSDQEGQSCSYGPGRVGTCCGGACVDVNADPNNCLFCGATCSSGYCQANYGCTELPPASNCNESCPSGTICANTSCVDSSCTLGPYCLASDGAVGSCCASGACAHLDSDDANCGACGLACPSGSTCTSGVCGGTQACTAGHVGSFCNLDAGISYLCCLGSGCTDTSTDTSNCGACGVACSATQSCDAGVCG
jgi:hypothetical protein